MRILIEISIKIYFMDIAAGNGPKVQSARAPATNRSHAHDTSMQRTIVKAHMTVTPAHETSTRTHARDNTHTSHTRRRRAGTLMTTRTQRARTRNVNATHVRESTHMTVTHAHETSTRTHACENTPTARTHAHETYMQSTFVNTRARRPRANASMHARIRARCGKRWEVSLLNDGHAWMRFDGTPSDALRLTNVIFTHLFVNLDTCRGQKRWVSTNN